MPLLLPAASDSERRSPSWSSIYVHPASSDPSADGDGGDGGPSRAPKTEAAGTVGLTASAALL